MSAPNYIVSKQHGLLCTTGRPAGYGRPACMGEVIQHAANRGLAKLVRGRNRG